jgi:MYXO-CTERM domain-containing protein
VFVEFTNWNLLTAARAPASGPPGGAPGYHNAAEYPAVRLEPVITQLGEHRSAEVIGLSARYFELAVPLAGPQRLRLHLDDPGPVPVVGTLYVVPPGGTQPGPALPMPGATLDLDVLPGQRLLLVASGAARGARTRMVAAYLDTDVAAPAGCAMGLGGAPGAGGFALLGLVALRLRRRIRS